MEAGDKLLSLLERKLEIMTEILRLTSKLEVSGEPEKALAEAEAYSDLVDKRERFIAEMKLIDTATDEFKQGGIFKPEFAEISGKIMAQIKSTAGEIINNEKAISEVLPRVQAHLKKGIREINEGKNLNQLYATQTDTSESSLYDKKK